MCRKRTALLNYRVSELGHVLLRSTIFGWLDCIIGENSFSVGLVGELFQPCSNQVETDEKAFV